MDVSPDYGMDDSITAADILDVLQLSSSYIYQFVACSASCQSLANGMQQNWKQLCISETNKGMVVRVLLGDLRYSSTVVCNNHYSSQTVDHHLKNLCHILTVRQSY